MQKKDWKESVVYQVYPRSFKDSDGDGIGDLPGLLGKLDYLQELGVDIVWLSPVYVSPDVDHGYDIKNFRNIQPEYGTLEDWRKVLDGLHRRGIKLWMDLVLNHTSDEHPWFKEARSSRSSRCRDYYIWRPPGPDGGPPNNWTSYLGQPAWTYDEGSGEYYLHLYNSKQPDLNWDNPELREEMYRMMAFWCEQGIDGFRMDAVNSISKDQRFPDTKLEKVQANGEPFSKNGPRIHEFLHEMHERVFAKYGLVTAGEASKVDGEDVLLYTKPERGEMSMVLSAEAAKLGEDDKDMFVDNGWNLDDLREMMMVWQQNIGDGGGWFGLQLSNHDQPRMVNHFGDPGRYRAESAKMLATMLFTLRGTPFVLQGDELGMTNHPGLTEIGDFKEQQALAYYKVMVEENGEPEDTIMERIIAKSRDHARTPMQWDDSPQAGFTEGTPWLPVHPDYREVNVKAQQADPQSVLSWYKRLIALRKKHPVLVYGEYKPVLKGHEHIFGYTRTHKEEKGQWLILLNFSGDEARWDLDEDTAQSFAGAELLLCNYETDGRDGPELLSNALAGAGASGGLESSFGIHSPASSDSSAIKLDRNAAEGVLRPYEALVFRTGH